MLYEFHSDSMIIKFRIWEGSWPNLAEWVSDSDSPRNSESGATSLVEFGFHLGENGHVCGLCLGPG